MATSFDGVKHTINHWMKKDRKTYRDKFVINDTYENNEKLRERLDYLTQYGKGKHPVDLQKVIRIYDDRFYIDHDG